MKIARVITVPIGAMGSRDLLSHLGRTDLKIDLITSPGEGFEDLKKLGLNKVIQLKMKRDISIFSDIVSVVNLIKILRAGKYDVIHSHTPKAGLVSAIAGFLVGVPKRVHSYTGQRWETLRGFRKWMLIFAEKLIGLLSTDCLADSHSQVKILSQSRIVAPNFIRCLGEGSLSGVSLCRFHEGLKEIHRNKVRLELDIPKENKVFVFVGRVVKDKGVGELLQAFEQLLHKRDDVSLVVIGPVEDEQNPLEDFQYDLLRNLKNLRRLDFCTRPEVYLAASDVLLLPSYREGFPSVVLEAGAIGVPSIIADFNGAHEVVLQGKTGFIVPKKDVNALENKMLLLCEDSHLLEMISKTGIDRVHEKFSSKVLVRYYLELYKSV